MENGWKIIASMEILRPLHYESGIEARITDATGGRRRPFGDVQSALLWLTSFRPIYGNRALPTVSKIDKIKTIGRMLAWNLTKPSIWYSVPLLRRLISLLTEYVAENQPMTPESLVEFGRIADGIPFDVVPHLDPGVMDQMIAAHWR